MPLLKRFLRWGGYALFAALVGASGILAWMYLWVLPHIQDYKGTLEDLLSSSTGFQVRLQSIEGEWGGARPRFTLHGVALLDNTNKPVLRFNQIHGRFGWRSVLTLEPRFHLLTVSGTTLALRRTPDGKFHLGGIVIDPQSPNHDFSDWLLKQGEVAMSDVSLTWIDELRQAPPLVFKNIAFDLKSLGRRHRFTLTAVPPSNLSGPIEVDGQLYGHHADRPVEWSGKVNGVLRDLNLGTLSSWIDIKTAPTGRGGVAFLAQMEKGRWIDLDANLNMVDVGAHLDQDNAPAHFSRLTGNVGWESKNGMQAVKLSSVRMVTDAGRPVGPINAHFGWNAGSYRMMVDGLDLRAMDVLLPLVPLSQAQRNEFAALGPAGQVDHFSASWNKSASPDGVTPFSLDARFRGLTWKAVGKLPGVAGLTGSVKGNQDKGSFDLAIASGQLDLPMLFRDPVMDWSRLSAEGGWLHKQSGYELQLANVNLENADMSGSLAGIYLVGQNQPDRIDLSGRLERAVAQSVYKYMPLVVNEHTYDWLKNAIQAGNARQVGFVLRGPPRHFPFRNDVGGVFHVDAQINDAALKYADDWPRIDGMDGELRFRGGRIEIFTDHAQIYNAQLHKVHAVIDDFESHDPMLDVSGEAVGPVGEFVRFANFSPVADRIGNLTDEMSGSGQLGLALNLKVPLHRSHDTTVAGRITFNNDTVFPASDVPRLEQISGKLDFTGDGVSAERISAKILGGPAIISVSHAEAHTHVTAHGTLAASSLAPWLGQSLGGQLKGKADWQGELVLGDRQTELKAQSNLVGLQSDLPAPLAKSAGQAVALNIERQSSREGPAISTATYGNIVNAIWQTRNSPSGAVLDRGEVRFGGKAQMPQQPGISIAGTLHDFGLGRWLDLLPDGGDEQTSQLSGINLTLSSMEFLGRRFSDVNLNGKLRGGILKVDVNAQGVQGSLAYRKRSSGEAARVSGMFRQLIIPAAQPGSSGGNSQRMSASGFPVLDVTVDDLRMDKTSLGRLEATAHGGAQGLVIDQLKLSSPDSTIDMTGVWRDGGIGETRVNVNADIKDEGRMLARFGFPDMVKRGKGTVSGDVAWQGSPADFSFHTLDGTLDLKSEDGQFMKVNPGAAKLLGIISLQSIPRRLTLDFRDIFSSGFAFDEISATLRIASGNVYSNDFRMKGPAATVKMSGVARLADESVQLRVEVSPRLSEGVAVAGALLGGPVAGLGALAVQKLLKDPLEAATSSEYLINGPWTDPVVTKLVREKQKPQQQGIRQDG